MVSGSVENNFNQLLFILLQMIISSLTFNSNFIQNIEGWDGLE